jgi:hypothetical protein
MNNDAVDITSRELKMLLFNIQDKDTGLYLLGNDWAEEPEWFDGREVKEIMSKVDAELLPRYVVNSHDFDSVE